MLSWLTRLHSSSEYSPTACRTSASGQLLLDRALLAVQTRLGLAMALELLADRRRVPAQLVDHAFESRLVVAAHALAHRRRGLVAGRVQAGEPLLVLGALLQEPFDRRLSIRWVVWP